MGSTVKDRVGVADVLSSTADNGEVRCKLGYLFGDIGIDNAAPVWGLGGFVARPQDPSDDGAAQAFYLQDANRRYVIAMRDNRFAANVGTLDPGDLGMFVDGDAKIVVKQARDAVAAYTVNQRVDQSMLFEMSGADGTIKLTNGKCFILAEDDGINAKLSIGISGGASITLYEDGTVSIDGAYFNCATGGGRLGVLAPQIPGLPAPAGSIVYGPTGLAAVASSNWTVTP